MLKRLIRRYHKKIAIKRITEVMHSNNVPLDPDNILQVFRDCSVKSKDGLIRWLYKDEKEKDTMDTLKEIAKVLNVAFW